MNNKRLLFFGLIAFLSVALISCIKQEEVDRETVLEATPDPIVEGGWRKMGGFMNQELSHMDWMFAIGNKAYFSFSYMPDVPWIDLASNFWEYDPATNKFSPRANIPDFDCCGTRFVINNKGYFKKGDIFIAYDPQSDSWSPQAAMPDTATFKFSEGTLFSIGNSAYCLGGYNVYDGGLYVDCMYEYQQESNQWIQKEAFGFWGNHYSTVRNGPYLTIGQKAYEMAISSDLTYYFMAEYDSDTDRYRSLSECPFYDLYPGDWGYVLQGRFHVLASQGSQTDPIQIISYDPETEQWELSDGPPGGDISLVRDAFSLSNGKAYAVLFNIETKKLDIWEYNP